MQLKIAIIGSRGYPYIYSGYETFVAELSQRLVNQNIEVSVYCHRTLFKNHPKIVNGIKLIYMPSLEYKILSQFSHSLLATIHALFRKYDLILYVNSANGPFGLFTKLFRKKTLINVDGLEWLRPKWKGLGSKYFYWASKMAAKFFNVIITDSHEMKKIFDKEFGVKSEMIAYGANIGFSKNHQLIRRWNLQKEGYYLIVGRLIPDNNVELIVQEFTSSPSEKKLVVVGDVPYSDTYAQTIKSINDNRLVFTGYVYDQDNLAELYLNCFVYLHGHEYGGTNPTLLKALAYGNAIVALDTVFSREVLQNGEYGKFFSKKQDSLKNLIIRIEEHPDELIEFRKKSRQRIINHYTWEKITEQYIELFNRVLNSRYN